MRKTITLTVELDSKNHAEKIVWDATDKPDAGVSETKSVSISLWDDKYKSTMRIDLWTKDMPVLEMKRFYIETIGGMAQSALTATGDEFMASEMNALCEKLVKHLQETKEPGS
jgi:gliding motility-associated protein GldC